MEPLVGQIWSAGPTLDTQRLKYTLVLSLSVNTENSCCFQAGGQSDLLSNIKVDFLLLALTSLENFHHLVFLGVNMSFK